MLIVTGSDDNYVAGVLVLIASAAFHNPNARFAVLDMGISEQNRDRIDKLALRLGVEIRRIEISENSFDQMIVRRNHLTRGAYLRLLIPDLFLDEDRVIYMDCDIAVMDDLSMLAKVDLGTNIIAAVSCPSPNPAELSATGHIFGSYINSGLLVMNLPVWREENIAKKCMEYLCIPDCPRLCEDQSAINVVAKDRIELLPARFNVYSDPGSYKHADDFPKTPAVVHYVVNNKPWNGPVNLGKIWQFHAARIADLMPPPKKMFLRRRLSLLNRKRKMALGLLIGSEKYKMRQWMTHHMDVSITNFYLSKMK